MQIVISIQRNVDGGCSFEWYKMQINEKRMKSHGYKVVNKIGGN